MTQPNSGVECFVLIPSSPRVVDKESALRERKCSATGVPSSRLHVGGSSCTQYPRVTLFEILDYHISTSGPIAIVNGPECSEGPIYGCSLSWTIIVMRLGEHLPSMGDGVLMALLSIYNPKY